MQDGKFHPHTQSKGVRSRRDTTKKTQGVKTERKARNFFEEQEKEENKTVAKFEHADRRTGSRTFHLGDFRLITIYPEREDYYECKICGGLEAID
jgi:hypothetical protein